MSFPTSSASPGLPVPGLSDAVAPVVLRLYVAGMTGRSQAALQSAKRFCTAAASVAGTRMPVLEVVDLFQQPDLARADRVVAVPALVRRDAHRIRHCIGAFDDHVGLRLRLGLDPSRPEAVDA